MYQTIALFSIGIGIVAVSLLVNWILKSNRLVVHSTLHITTEDCPYDTRVLKEYIDLFVEQYAGYKGIPIDVVRSSLQNTHIKFGNPYPEVGTSKTAKSKEFTGITVGNQIILKPAKKLYDTALFHELIHVILGGDRYHMDKAFSALPLKLYNLAVRLNLE